MKKQLFDVFTLAFYHVNVDVIIFINLHKSKVSSILDTNTKFSENLTSDIHTRVCVSAGKKC